ncbi:MAG: trimethylamine corrinoid protein 2 [Candidatus Latescibacterota bacterium]
MFECKPDFEQVLERYEAWWDAQVLDRALVSITYPAPPARQVPWPAARHASLCDRWLDTDFAVRSTEARMANTVWAADALPIAFPNLGPEVFSACYGCPLEFGETTSWSVPVLRDWSPQAVDGLRLDRTSFYFRKLVEISDALVEVGRGRFIVGYTDVHPGGDAVAAFRDPQQLCIDVLERPHEVRALVERVTDDFLGFFDFFYARLSAQGMPCTSWLPATCRGRYHIPSNDFSCMISTPLFEEIFLPGIARECRHVDRSIYHLDGPQALRFLDLLLDVPEIQAIQWVPGAGHDHWVDWIPVYRRIQERGKAFCLSVPLEELDQVFAALRPEGAWIQLGGVPDEESARAALGAVARWGR